MIVVSYALVSTGKPPLDVAPRESDKFFLESVLLRAVSILIRIYKSPRTITIIS